MSLRALDGTAWSPTTARAGLPILVEFARNRTPIFYSQWDNEIARRKLGKSKAPFYITYRYPAGRVGDACIEFANSEGRRVPPLNLIVVNLGGAPGSGANYYIERYCKDFLGRKMRVADLDSEERAAIVREIQEEVYDYRDWDKMLGAFGLRPAPQAGVTPSKRRKPKPSNWHGGPESEGHKKLKKYIAEHPEVVGLPSGPPGREEFLLWSGDRIDVHFAGPALGVEVKSKEASWDEIHRGLFQAIKYRAVLRAQQQYQKQIPRADCVLAIGPMMPTDLRAIAQLFRIRVFDSLSRYLT